MVEGVYGFHSFLIVYEQPEVHSTKRVAYSMNQGASHLTTG